MKVYLAWVGSYSDARVVGVYSDEDVAKRVSKAIDGRDSYVQTFIVDGGPKPPEEDGLVLWSVSSMSANSIEVDDCYRGDRYWSGLDDAAIGQVVGQWGGDNDPMAVQVYARDEAHATKIAADKFREHVALRGSGGRA